MTTITLRATISAINLGFSLGGFLRHAAHRVSGLYADFNRYMDAAHRVPGPKS